MKLWDRSVPRLPLPNESVENLKQMGITPIPLDPFKFSGPCVVGLLQVSNPHLGLTQSSPTPHLTLT